MDRNRVSSALGAIFLCLIAGRAVAQDIPVVTVPWLGDPNEQHQVTNGGSLILQGTARPPVGCTLVSGTWDPGDGSGPVAISVANPRVLELTHTYIGLPNTVTPYTATLSVEDSCGNTGTDTFRVAVVDPSTLGTEVNMAIDHGLWALYKRQQLGNVSGVDTGVWTSQNQTAATASCVQAFEISNHLEISDPDEDPYAETVARGLAHLWTDLTVVNIGVQAAGDPDFNANGIGLQANFGGRPIYVGGQVIDAIVASRTPGAIAPLGDATWVMGRTYAEVVQDMLDAYSWGQADAGSARGSWRYSWNSDGDNSAAQWWSIGVLAAEGDLFGPFVTVPQFVKDENIMDGVFLKNSQFLDFTNAGNDGRMGYTNTAPISNNGMNTTPSGIVQFIADGMLSDDPRFKAAERFMTREWFGGNGPQEHQQIYGMFSGAKAMRLAQPNAIELMDDGAGIAGPTLDWYGSDMNTGDPVNGVARVLVNKQLGDGTWDSNWVIDDIASSWAIIVLSPTIVDLPPVAVCDVDPAVTGVNVPVEFDGSQSFHLDPDKSVTDWEWDFDGDDLPDDFGPVVTTSFAVLGDYTVKLTVRDGEGGSDTQDCLVSIIPPPIPPNSDPGGPYDFCFDALDLFILDGSNSSDADGFIVEWAWDFDPQPLNLSFDDAFGDLVDVTAFFTGLGPGLYDVALRVTDNDGGSNVDFTTVEVYDFGNCPDDPNDPPEFTPPSPCGEGLMASVGVELNFDVCAIDPNALDEVTLTMLSGPPTAMFSADPPANAVCGTFSWIPGNDHVGTHTITFAAVDLNGRNASCEVTVEVAECFLVIAAGHGSDGVVMGGHRFNTQVSDVLAFYPVTMEDYPAIPVELTRKVLDGIAGSTMLPGTFEYPKNKPNLTAQIVMFNPSVFPENADQFSPVIDVWVKASGLSRFIVSGVEDGITISASSYAEDGTVFVTFPFGIDGF